MQGTIKCWQAESMVVESVGGGAQDVQSSLRVIFTEFQDITCPPFRFNGNNPGRGYYELGKSVNTKDSAVIWKITGRNGVICRFQRKPHCLDWALDNTL